MLFQMKKKKKKSLLIPSSYARSTALPPQYCHCPAWDRNPSCIEQLLRKLWFKLYAMKCLLYQSLLGYSLFSSAICIALTSIYPKTAITKEVFTRLYLTHPKRDSFNKYVWSLWLQKARKDFAGGWCHLRFNFLVTVSTHLLFGWQKLLQQCC